MVSARSLPDSRLYSGGTIAPADTVAPPALGNPSVGHSRTEPKRVNSFPKAKMEALMRVMAAKKREISAVQAEKKNGSKEKYLRRAEVESLLAERSVKQADDHEADAPETASKKRKLDRQQAKEASEEASSRSSRQKKKQSEHTEDPNREDEGEGEALLSWPDMRRRLRELGEPITLFGESLKNRMTRLRRAEIDAATRQEEGLGAGHDIRNRFVGDNDDGEQREHMDTADDAAEDAEEFDALAPSAGGGSNGGGSQHKNKIEAGEDVDEEQDLDKVVYRFFKSMLQLWEKDLADRPDHVKRTAQGKIAVKTMKQCKDYIRPLRSRDSNAAEE
ncbi:hypothetical protein BBJ28_00007263 [Nothophytophthora sp. Chile5]|nr:hypothetical protein BBJ28_00007263 [Nothophytophthora sp. Chile5]